MKCNATIIRNKKAKILNYKDDTSENCQKLLEKALQSIEKKLNPEIINKSVDAKLSPIESLDEVSKINQEVLLKEYVISYICGIFNQTISDFAIVDNQIKRIVTPHINTLETPDSLKPEFTYNPEKKKLVFKQLIAKLNNTKTWVINRIISKIEAISDDDLYDMFKDYFDSTLININYRKIFITRKNICLANLKELVESIENSNIYI